MRFKPIRKIEVQVFSQTTEPPRHRYYSFWQIFGVIIAMILAVIGFIIIDPTQIIKKWSDVSLFRLYSQNKDLQKTVMQIREETDEASKKLVLSDSLRNSIAKTAGIPQDSEMKPETSYVEPHRFGSIGPARNMNRIRSAHREFLEFVQDMKQDSIYAKTLPLIQPLKHHAMVTARFGLMHDEAIDAEIPHKGIDWATFEGDTVIAPGNGMVASVINDKGFGLTITIVHNKRTETYYAHLSKALVSPGKSIKRGDPIALVGQSGRSAGPHLHYEIRIYGVQVNPEDYFLSP